MRPIVIRGIEYSGHIPKVVRKLFHIPKDVSARPTERHPAEKTWYFVSKRRQVKTGTAEEPDHVPVNTQRSFHIPDDESAQPAVPRHPAEKTWHRASERKSGDRPNSLKASSSNHSQSVASIPSATSWHSAQRLSPEHSPKKANAADGVRGGTALLTTTPPGLSDLLLAFEIPKYSFHFCVADAADLEKALRVFAGGMRTRTDTYRGTREVFQPFRQELNLDRSVRAAFSFGRRDWMDAAKTVMRLQLVDINAPDEYGETLLEQVLSQPEVYPEKIAQLQNTSDLQANNENQPLSAEERLQVLLEYGADPLAPSKDGRPMIAIAADNATESTVRKLLLHPDAQLPASALTLVKTGRGLALLNKIGVSVHAQDGHGKTPLHHAMTGDVVKALVKAGADVEAVDHFLFTPLHTPKNAEVARALIETGARLNVSDKRGRTPLHYAQTREIAQVFLMKDRHAVQWRDQSGRTALHYARTAGVVEVLTDADAQPDAKDYQGRTPLHLVLTCEVAQALIDAGANVNAVDAKRRTPFDLALSDDVRQVLLAHGAGQKR